ncbi:MAG: uracil-DNA glycosylase [Rhodocyclaceae bacterium]|nr:uracil-DNA glycosylase [Rhodocyclaceae bacterium]
MSLSREQILHEMGLGPIWRVREPLPVLATDVPSAPVIPSPPVEVRPATQQCQTLPSATVDGLNWPDLSQQVADCRACVLCQQRKQAVLGVGDRQADWLFVGEGPGAEEDVKGEPFVGQAGKLLDNMLAALDLGRDRKVYIANAVKCRPPGNRTPEAAEMTACRPYLERQIALIKPKIIVLLGKAAMYSVLHDDSTLASKRGQRLSYQGIPVVVTYHPSYLLRNLPDKAKAWEDLLLARRLWRESSKTAQT